MDSDSDDNLIDEDEIERNLPHRQFSFTRSRPSVRKEGRTKYRDYHSIDWLRETSKDKKRQILIEQDRKSGRFYDRSYSIFDKDSFKFYKNPRGSKSKLGRVFPMVVVSILPHAECV